MTTALEIISDALEENGYKASETPIEPDDLQLGLRKLNDMLSEWDGSGIKLGASPVEKAGDTLRIPRWAVAAVKMNLAGRLAGPFKRPITAELASSISVSTKNLIRALSKPIDVQYPGTLPLGTGNQCNDDWDDRFFAQNEKENF